MEQKEDPSVVPVLIDDFKLDTEDKNDNSTMSKQSRKRKANRRSKLGIKNKSDTIDLKFIKSNADGYITKQESFREIAANEAPDMILMNYTNLKGRRKVNIPNYFSFVKNREKNKGGVATVVAII